MSFANGFGKAPSTPVEYIFGRKNAMQFTVAKFAGGDTPLEEYEVESPSEGTASCTCMAWRSKKTRPCKHIDMVATWIEAGQPEAGMYVCLGKGKDWTFAVKPQL